MSPKNRKYNRIEALFSKSPPAVPDSPRPAAAKTPIPKPSAAEPADRSGAGFSAGRKQAAPPVETPPSPPPNVLSVPLTVSGKTIGSMQASGNEAWTGREIGIARGVAARLARHLEELSRAQGEAKPGR
jgi:hypothetical protein